MMVVYGLTCLALGGVIGAFIGARFACRRDVAPKPVYLPAYAQNRINEQNIADKKVTICGAEWTVYGGNGNG